MAVNESFIGPNGSNPWVQMENQPQYLLSLTGQSKAGQRPFVEQFLLPEVLWFLYSFAGSLGQDEREFVNELATIASRAAKQDIPFLLDGGLTVIRHGFPRGTFDLVFLKHGAEELYEKVRRACQRDE